MRELEIYDWNKEGSEKLENSKFRILDTTLRDGVQTPGIKQPSLKDKLRIIDYDAQMGIEAIDVCLPSDPKTPFFQEGIQCARYINQKYPQIEIVVLARTIQSDVNATLTFGEEAGVKPSVILFRGSSDLRLLAEDWNEEEIIEQMRKFAAQLTERGHKVICATEDTTRSRPDFLKRVFTAGIEGGASELCIADTVGYADPTGIENQINWLKREFAGNTHLKMQFHGHDDTGNAVANSIKAIEAGVETIHVTWSGVGERTGNTSLEGILSNLERRNIHKYDLSCVVEGARFVANSLGVPIPRNHHLVGEKVYSVESGIHVAGINKALRAGLEGLSGIVYSAVDPRRVGRDHEVSIGPLGGDHSVAWVLREMGIDFTRERSLALLTFARTKNSALTEQEIIDIIKKLGKE
ncbi:MAG: hypothetical protein A2860_00590 [Candidatus Levybacteria bacterium RIFCSPHIGHO2_01_FULL_37_33]|nr:MAG: hypothetical protein A2860_00590 [Candidatus Levybacteria bacterium RIFCSPHIGHO2_01_FULL_37_33]